MKIICKFTWQCYRVCTSTSMLLLVDEILQQNKRLLINGNTNGATKGKWATKSSLYSFYSLTNLKKR